MSWARLCGRLDGSLTVCHPRKPNSVTLPPLLWKPLLMLRNKRSGTSIMNIWVRPMQVLQAQIIAIVQTQRHLGKLSFPRRYQPWSNPQEVQQGITGIVSRRWRLVNPSHSPNGRAGMSSAGYLLVSDLPLSAPSNSQRFFHSDVLWHCCQGGKHWVE